MSKSNSSLKLIISSVVISAIVLGIFAVIFLLYLVPAYQITNDSIYEGLIRFFPILVGLILIQIGIIVGRRNDKEEDKDDEEDTDYPTVGNVEIRNTVVTRDNKGNITQVDFDVTMNNVDRDDYKDAAAQASAIVITRLGIDIDDVKVAKMSSTDKSNLVHVTILLK